MGEQKVMDRHLLRIWVAATDIGRKNRNLRRIRGLASLYTDINSLAVSLFLSIHSPDGLFVGYQFSFSASLGAALRNTKRGGNVIRHRAVGRVSVRCPVRRTKLRGRTTQPQAGRENAWLLQQCRTVISFRHPCVPFRSNANCMDAVAHSYLKRCHDSRTSARKTIFRL